MRSYNVKKDGSGNSVESDYLNRGLKRAEELQVYDSSTIRWEQTTRGMRAHANIPPSATGASGYMGEYDPTISYSAGQSFKISVALTIRTHVIPIGIWAVRPSSSVVDAQGFGPWDGNLPANPATTATMDMDKLFFDPAHPPTLGAFPNDRLYAELEIPLC